MVLSKHLHRLRKDQRGTVSIIMGLLIVPLVGALGIGFEVSNWYMTGRGMQNAADVLLTTNGALGVTRPKKFGMTAAIARMIFPRASATSIANIDTLVTVALFSGVGLLLSLCVLILDQYIPGEWF